MVAVEVVETPHQHACTLLTWRNPYQRGDDSFRTIRNKASGLSSTTPNSIVLKAIKPFEWPAALSLGQALGLTVHP